MMVPAIREVESLTAISTLERPARGIDRAVLRDAAYGRTPPPVAGSLVR